MEIVVNEEQIREIVADEVNKTVRKRIREMQGDYTSKGYLEELMRNIIWDTLMKKIPNLDNYVKNKIDEVVSYHKNRMEVPKKSEIIEYIVNSLEEED